MLFLKMLALFQFCMGDILLGFQPVVWVFWEGNCLVVQDSIALHCQRITQTHFNPFAAEVIFVQCTKKQIIMKIIGTKSCGYSYESSHWVLSDEYPFARVSFIFLLFLSYFILANLATSSISVKNHNNHLYFFDWVGCRWPKDIVQIHVFLWM